MTSKHLNRRQVRGLNKIGDALLPGYGSLPAFSSLNCAKHADRVLDHMPRRDLSDLKLLLMLMSFLPTILVRLFLSTLEKSYALPGPIGGFLRFVRIGIRGLIMTLYYCDPKVVSAIGYNARVFTADLQACD